MLRFVSYSLGLLLLVACNTDRILPASTGSAGEVLVVMTDAHWESDMGEALRGSMEQWIEGLPQREPRFTLVHFTPATFSSMLNTHRNIIIAEMSPKIAKAEVRHDFEHWSQGQVLVTIVAPSTKIWVETFNQHADRINELIDRTERKRLQASQAKRDDPAHTARTEEHFGISMNVPKDFIMALGNDEFMHFRRDRLMQTRSANGPAMSHQVIDGIVIYSYPYTSDSTFTRDALMDKRDTLLRKYMPGPVDSSYMATQRFFQDLDLRPSLRQVPLDTLFATEMRGLWGMVGAKMGGPFISVSFVHPDGDRVIAVEGYVHAPQFEKREFLRSIDAIIHSARPVLKETS